MVHVVVLEAGPVQAAVEVEGRKKDIGKGGHPVLVAAAPEVCPVPHVMEQGKTLDPSTKMRSSVNLW